MAAVARTQADLAGLAASVSAIEPVAVDYRDIDGLRRRLSGPAYDAALLYAPFAEPATLAVVRDAVTGPVVQLLTSGVAAPLDPADAAGGYDLSRLPRAPAQPWFRVLLGWTPESSWHSPEQVSTVALQALTEQRDLALGVVRPWAARPPGG